MLELRVFEMRLTKAIKSATGYCIAWVLYFIGDAVSRLLVGDITVRFLFPIYSTCMTISIETQDRWSPHKGPWSLRHKVL